MAQIKKEHKRWRRCGSNFKEKEEYKKKNIKEEEEEAGECSVCQFVKSNCLIGFDQGWDGSFVAKLGISIFLIKSRQIIESVIKACQIMYTFHSLIKFRQIMCTFHSLFKSCQNKHFKVSSNFAKLCTHFKDSSNLVKLCTHFKVSSNLVKLCTHFLKMHVSKSQKSCQFIYKMRIT